MIRILNASTIVAGEETCYEYAGLSTDEKPVREDICTGSTFIEVDTGDVYFFNEEGASGQEWVKVGD